MASFTKNYKVQPNDKQRAALNTVFKSLCEYFVNEKNADVIVELDQFSETKIIADLIVNGTIFDTKIIGVRGGLKTF